jgi:hypothetical protein
VKERADLRRLIIFQWQDDGTYSVRRGTILDCTIEGVLQKDDPSACKEFVLGGALKAARKPKEAL